MYRARRTDTNKLTDGPRGRRALPFTLLDEASPTFTGRVQLILWDQKD